MSGPSPSMPMLAGVAAAWLISFPASAQNVTTIETPGSGAFSLCPSWLRFDTCQEYTDVALPHRLTIGDQVLLEFGDDTLHYRFTVGRIAKHGVLCVIGETENSTKTDNTIRVRSCLDISDKN